MQKKPNRVSSFDILEKENISDSVLITMKLIVFRYMMRYKSIKSSPEESRYLFLSSNVKKLSI